jgi:diketogulonate reductase-like aldo/keto reductase
MPMIGLGTFTGTRHHPPVPHHTMHDAVDSWLRLGGRSLDCAQNYLNEDEIGDAIAKNIAAGILTRDDLWVSSKLNNPYHRPEHVRAALEKTLLDLGLDHLDLYLMHWPTAFKYVPFDPTVRGFPQEYEPDQCVAITGVMWKDYDGPWPPPHLDTGVTIHETWDAMVECQKAGLVSNIGVCNFKVTLLHELICGTDFVPHVAQSEAHPFCQQWGLLDFCTKNGIQLQAYSPLGYGSFKAENERTVLTEPLLAKIAAKHGKSVAQVCLRWSVQRGVATPPFSLNPDELKENLTVGSWELDEEDISEIKTLQKVVDVRGMGKK